MGSERENEQLQAKIKQLEKIIHSYHIQYKAAMKATSLGLCKRIIMHALDDEQSLKGE